MASADRRAVEAIARWYRDPLLYVRQVFHVEPDIWQAEGLTAIATEPRLALSACVGPGKTTELAWIGWWFLDTRYDAQAIAASVTLDNLEANLWKELATWYGRAPHLRHAFDFQGKQIVSRERPETWWLQARGWPKDADPNAQASALGGLHAKHVLMLLDETGTLPDSVMVTAERVFANADIAEAKLATAWNPESTQGAAYRIATRDRARWRIITVTGDPDDPKRSPRISKSYAQEQIDLWGRDNDWVRVNVLGLFPLRGTDNLLGPDDVTRAQGRDVDPRSIANEASIWGLDPARSPNGDRSVLRERCGPVAFRPYVFRGLDGTQLGDRVSFLLNEAKRKPDYLFVDVGGVGASAYDRLKVLGWGRIMVGVDFAGEPEDANRFHDRNAEMHYRLAKWVETRGCLPLDSGVLASELTQRTFSFRVRGKRTAYAIESKDELKARGLPSPDEADALALTFASEHTPKREIDVELFARRRGRETRHARTWQEAR